MTRILSLDELAQQGPTGARIGVGGVHLARLPIALIASVLALGRRDFTYVSWGGGLPLELFLQADAIKGLSFVSRAWISLDYRRNSAKHWKPGGSKWKNGPLWL